MPDGSKDVRVVGRYALCDKIAGGGMATVHLGRLLGQAGFSRTVAIKRLHAHLAGDPEFVSMFIDEARLAARIHHPNVVSTLDVVARESELFLVMEYVHGESLARLLRSTVERRELVPPRIGAAIVAGFLHGLHAAHEARNERGEPLNMVHRDVSPQNVIVGIDGVSRVVDFGVAKAVGRMQTTRDGQLKGKLAYMAPEQITDGPVTRRTDIYAATIVFWELLTGRRLFQAENEAAVMNAVLTATAAPPSALAPVPTSLDSIVRRGLAREAEARFETAREMALAIEQSIDIALPSEVGAWVQDIAEQALTLRAELVGNIESSARIEPPSSGAHPTVPAPQRGGTTSVRPSPVLTEPPTMMTASSEGATPARASRKPIAVAALVVVVAVVVVVARLAVSNAPGKATMSGATASLPLPSTVAAPPPPPATASAAPADPPPPAAPPAASAPAASGKVDPPPASRAAAAGSSRPTAAPAAKHPAASNCDPPYRIDASGRKIFKVECL
jgi:serine/threonine-protein kinase